MNKYSVEWWYATGHGTEIIYAETPEAAEALFWKRFKPYLAMAYQRTKVTLLEESAD